jgi:hypothetical protein
MYRKNILEIDLVIELRLWLLYFKEGTMPRHNGNYPPLKKNLGITLNIANEVLNTTGNEGEAIATGLKQARSHFKKKREAKEVRGNNIT